jgi:hypothetical protein
VQVVLAAPLLRLAQVAVILFLMVLQLQVVVEVAVLTLMYLAHQHQLQVALEAEAFGQVQLVRLVTLQALHHLKAIMVVTPLVILTTLVVAEGAHLRLAVMRQTQGQGLAVMVEQGHHQACLESLQHTLVVEAVVVINTAQPPVLVALVAVALAVLVGVLAVQE